MLIAGATDSNEQAHRDGALSDGARVPRAGGEQAFRRSNAANMRAASAYAGGGGLRLLPLGRPRIPLKADISQPDDVETYKALVWINGAWENGLSVVLWRMRRAYCGRRGMDASPAAALQQERGAFAAGAAGAAALKNAAREKPHALRRGCLLRPTVAAGAYARRRADARRIPSPPGKSMPVSLSDLTRHPTPLRFLLSAAQAYVPSGSDNSVFETAAAPNRGSGGVRGDCIISPSA